MKKTKLIKLEKVLIRVVKNIDYKYMKFDMEERLYRIINELEYCVTYNYKKEYLPLQQFRILMDKIINVILLRDIGKPYYEYLEILEEYENLTGKREFLKRVKLEQDVINDRKCFLEKKLKDNNIDKECIRGYKHIKFNYYMGYLSNDSSRLIHDDNSTYKNKISKNTLEEVEQIILFFVSNIFISFCNDKKDKDYLRNIYRLNKKKIINNSSISKKNIKKLKKEIRGVA
ncbi:hypothetical protein [Clostridium perfringens]|uniref:Uncharacterized protein n=1 Tax=Clostridium perfringens TaxID=1502 RepID=A0AAP4EGA3_CLOPF|nr:hypothetical protein [Clostridium perfringens]MBO3313994.1 hypothetical protein [Clostridium perfringens]MDH2337129.1 hypothetical protein [Clostridium perfringens]